MGGPPPGSTPGKQQRGLRGIGEAQELGAPPKGIRDPPKRHWGAPQLGNPLKGTTGHPKS